MAQGFFTVLTGTRPEDDAEGPLLRSPRKGKSAAPMQRRKSVEEVEVAEIGRLSTVVGVVRSDLCRLEGAVAECRRDNSRTLAEVLRRQEDLIQSGTALDHVAVRDPLQITLLEEFVLDQVRQERRARAEELSELRRWAVELVHGCMQPPSTGAVGSRSSTGSRCSTQPCSSGGVGTRRAASKASSPLDTSGSTACSTSDISSDVRFGVAAMRAQMSELQDEVVRSQERLDMLGARVAALEQGEGGHGAPSDWAASLQQSAASSQRLEDGGAVAELLTRERVGQLAKAVHHSAASGGDRALHAGSAMRELREEDAVSRQEDLPASIARASSGANPPTFSDKLTSDIRTTPWAVSDAPHVSSSPSRLPALALDAPVVAIAPRGLVPPAPPRFRPDSLDARDTLDAGLSPRTPPQSKSRAATGRSSMSPPPGQRCLSPRADSLLPHRCIVPAEAAGATAAGSTFCGSGSRCGEDPDAEWDLKTRREAPPRARPEIADGMLR